MRTECMPAVHFGDDAGYLDVIDPAWCLTIWPPRPRLRRPCSRFVAKQFAMRTAGAPITEIAAVLGIKNRVGLYQMIDEQPGQATAPVLTPVVFVRGPGVDSATWAAVTAALQRRGWMVVRDRTQAWHLARGRVPVVLVDISHDQPVVGRVRARYNDAKEPELPLAGGRTVLDSLDRDQVALAVIEHLRDTRDLPSTPPPRPRPPATRLAAADLETQAQTKRSRLFLTTCGTGPKTPSPRAMPPLCTRWSPQLLPRRWLVSRTSTGLGSRSPRSLNSRPAEKPSA